MLFLSRMTGMSSSRVVEERTAEYTNITYDGASVSTSIIGHTVVSENSMTKESKEVEYQNSENNLYDHDLPKVAIYYIQYY